MKFWKGNRPKGFGEVVDKVLKVREANDTKNDLTAKS
jgi:hypothetical protein